MEVKATKAAPRGLKPGAWVDLGLTLPIFIVYHLGVVFLDVKNASDLATYALLDFAEGSRWLYLLYASAIGVIFAGIFAWLGRGEPFQARRLVQVACEGIAYAVVMRLAGAYVVGHLFAGNVEDDGVFTGFIMSLGAGFYEELSFRVILFGLGTKLLVWLFAKERLGLVQGTPRLGARAFFIALGWMIFAAAVFSAVHYIGPLGDAFDARTFLFRWTLGVCLSLVYALRGFAAAVWAHAVYDIWVLVL